WKLHPGSTVCVETTRIEEATLFAPPAVRTALAEDRLKSSHGQQRVASDDARGDQAEARVHERVPAKNGDTNDDQRDRRSPREQPTMTKHLLITASVALICGV